MTFVDFHYQAMAGGNEQYNAPNDIRIDHKETGLKVDRSAYADDISFAENLQAAIKQIES